MATARPRCVSKENLETLEWLIWHSRDADEFTKLCLIWLLRQSEGLTVSVRIADKAIGYRIVKGLHSMVSDGGTTQISKRFNAAGSDMLVDYGGAAITNFATPWGEVKGLFPAPGEIEAIVPADPYKD